MIVCLLFDFFFLVLDHDDNHSQQKTNEKLLPAVRSPALGSMELRVVVFLGVVVFDDSTVKQDVLNVTNNVVLSMI